MYSRVCKGFALLTCLLFSFISIFAQAQNPLVKAAELSFNVQPQQCVTLRQGRDCFASIKIYWQTNTEQAICLYQIHKKKPNNQEKVICWAKNHSGRANVAFESNNNVTYQLRTLEENRLMAEKEVVVSWLHTDTTRRRRWRLF